MQDASMESSGVEPPADVRNGFTDHLQDRLDVLSVFS